MRFGQKKYDFLSKSGFFGSLAVHLRAREKTFLVFLIFQKFLKNSKNTGFLFFEKIFSKNKTVFFEHRDFLGGIFRKKVVRPIRNFSVF